MTIQFFRVVIAESMLWEEKQTWLIRLQSHKLEQRSVIHLNGTYTDSRHVSPAPHDEDGQVVSCAIRHDQHLRPRLARGVRVERLQPGRL